jgi:hypothetical protein
VGGCLARRLLIDLEAFERQVSGLVFPRGTECRLGSWAGGRGPGTGSRGCSSNCSVGPRAPGTRLKLSRFYPSFPRSGCSRNYHCTTTVVFGFVPMNALTGTLGALVLSLFPLFFPLWHGTGVGTIGVCSLRIFFSTFMLKRLKSRKGCTNFFRNYYFTLFCFNITAPTAIAVPTAIT